MKLCNHNMGNKNDLPGNNTKLVDLSNTVRPVKTDFLHLITHFLGFDAGQTSGSLFISDCTEVS